MLPTGNKLPNSYRKARAAIKNLLVPVRNFDCCSNDCIVYRNSSRGEFKDLNKCPKCGTSRFQPGTSSARKTFKYIPLIPRIKRMFSNKKVSEILQSHMHGQSNSEYKPSKISDLHQSYAWKSLYGKEGPFEGDPRGLSFSLCVDGTNPFSKESISYSMWPIMLSFVELASKAM